MSDLLKYNMLIYVEDNTDTSDPVRAKIKSIDTTTGYTLSYYEKQTFTVAAAGGPYSLLPPVTPTVVNDNLQYFLKITYGPAVALADQFVHVNDDAVGVRTVRNFGAGSIGTSLAITNPNVAASISGEIIWFIRSN